MKENNGKKLDIKVLLTMLLIIVSVILYLTGRGGSGETDGTAAPAISVEPAGSTEKAQPIETSAQPDHSEESTAAEAAPQETSAPQTDGETTAEYVAYTFRSRSLLNSHYEKHGIEMGFQSAAEYEKAASDVINNPNALSKTEKEDGDFVFYLEETNEFVILSTDGYIRTYFLPSAGKAYYDRQ